MEKAFEHIGIYDFWGIFWAGIINLTTWVIAFAITTPSFCKIIYIIKDYFWFSLIVYIVLGYFLGSLLHELGRLCKDKTKILGEDAITHYLNGNKINTCFKKELIEILKEDIHFDNSSISIAECEFIYDYCSTYLKRYNLNARSDKTQSIYGFSRGVFIGHLLFSIVYSIILLVNKIQTYQTIILLFLTVLSTFLFWNRTRIYNNNKVKNVLMMYYIERETQKGSSKN